MEPKWRAASLPRAAPAWFGLCAVSTALGTSPCPSWKAAQHKAGPFTLPEQQAPRKLPEEPSKTVALSASGCSSSTCQGVPLLRMPTSLSLRCPTSIPTNKFVAKGSAIAVLRCSCPQSSSSLLAVVLSPRFGWETGLCVGTSSSGDTVCA